MQLSNIIGLPVFSIYECQSVGYVLNVVLNHKLNKISHIIISDEDNETIYTINIYNIYKITSECLLIRNNTKLSVNQIKENSVMNNIILTIDGQKDYVKDVLIDQNYNIKSIQGQKLNFGFLDVLCKQNNIILLKPNNPQIKRKNFRPRLKKVNIPKTDAHPVSILDNISRPTLIKVNNTAQTIGKHLSANLYSHQNEILAAKGSVVTQSTINIARQFGVLNQLIALAK